MARARAIDGDACDRLEPRLRAVHSGDDGRFEVALLLAVAHPALLPALERGDARIPLPGERPWRHSPRLPAKGEGPEGFRRSLRRLARHEMLRIALSELLPEEAGGCDVEASARQLSDLADVTIAAALEEACAEAFERFGRPRGPDGRPSALAVFGMGKLGGRELNAGSDVDLVCFYDSDRCVAQRGETETSAHQVWSRVVRRMTENLEEVTSDGFVWRVDLRLRPEGGSGPLVNSLAAAERYYETFGRLWERAAWLRARFVAGDADLGRDVLRMLEPFVWRRRVDPTIPPQLYALIHRARRELGGRRGVDLKLGAGGIREAEFFVQALQLVWGGGQPRVRRRHTLQAAAALLEAGLLTHREWDHVGAAYRALRRAEHALHFGTGVQTHTLPPDPAVRERIGRALGFADARDFERDLEVHLSRVGELWSGLLPEADVGPSRWRDALQALDRADEVAFGEALQAVGMPLDWGQAALDGRPHGALVRDLFALGAHPDAPLGRRARELFPALGPTLLDALIDAADPPQAASYLRRMWSRIIHPAVYTKLLSDDAAAVRRLVTALGGSAFVGERVATRPELADLVLFEPAVPSPADARDEMLDALGAPVEDGADGAEQRVAAMRRAQGRITAQVALADLAGRLGTEQATLVLSALADAGLEVAARTALGCGPREPIEGLAILAMGKLGGREIGYGSDLDVIFLYDPSVAEDAVAYATRWARRVLRLLSTPHHEGAGYELDARLRPSGNQGLLVVSVDGFERYHDASDQDEARGRRPGDRAATWERVALLRARFAAGDAALGARAMRVAHRAAFERGGEVGRLAADIHGLRVRMQDELARETAVRRDLKFGRGGLLDIELAVQLLQLEHGADERVRTTRTASAIQALAEVGAIDESDRAALGDGYAFLRRLEQRLRVVHGDSAHLIEERAAGLTPLARRMGIVDQPSRPAARALMEAYRVVTDDVRRSYQRIVEARIDQEGKS